MFFGGSGTLDDRYEGVELAIGGLDVVLNLGAPEQLAVAAEEADGHQFRQGKAEFGNTDVGELLQVVVVEPEALPAVQVAVVLVERGKLSSSSVSRMR